MTLVRVDAHGTSACIGCGRAIRGEVHRCDVCRGEYLCVECAEVCCEEVMVGALTAGQEIETCLTGRVGVVVKRRPDCVDVEFESGARRLALPVVVRARSRVRRRVRRRG